MKMSGIFTEYSEKIEIFKSEPFKKYKIFSSQNVKLGIGYFEFDSETIEKYKDDYLMSGNLILSGRKIYKYVDKKLKFVRLSTSSAKAMYNKYSNMYDGINKYKGKYAALKDDIVKNCKHKILGFERLRYCNNEMIFTLPFAFYSPENIMQADKNIPLVIYLHGYTNGGEKNILPFTECYAIVNKIKKGIDKNPCYMLIPSIPRRESFFANNGRPLFAKGDIDDNITALLNKLSEEYHIDKNRIYIIGISNGAIGIWSQLKLHPDRYAAAIPLMGAVPPPKDDFYNSIKDLPIWVGHAENDKNVLVGESNGTVGSDIIVEGLKKAGSQKVKYSRYTSYGHAMFRVFIRKEAWYNWLFEQAK